MENEERESVVAVAVDKDKSGQYALKWAVENVLGRQQPIKLIHVIQTSPSICTPAYMRRATSMITVRNNRGDEFDAAAQHHDTMEVFLPFRCYCARRHIKCELVVLERQDVARALIEYVSQYGVESLLLGAPSKNGLSRLFKAADIPATVMKWAPDFCNVYVVYKGRCNAIRAAARPVPSVPVATPRTPSNPPLSTKCYDEYPTSEAELLHMNSGRSSTDSTSFASFYESLDRSSVDHSSSRWPLSLDNNNNHHNNHHQPEFQPSSSSNSSNHHHQPEFQTSSNSSTPRGDLISLLDSCSESPQSCGRSSSASQDGEEEKDEIIKQLKKELKQTIDMYNAACKDALNSKQKVSHLEEREREWEAKFKAAIDAAEQRIKLEVQKRMAAEKKAVKECEEKTQVLNALGHSHRVLKHQSLFHIFVVLFLFYCYFSVFVKTI